jgi:serine-type D-Ala-D-Ala carboxypeptidase/endopeptidase
MSGGVVGMRCRRKKTSMGIDGTAMLHRREFLLGSIGAGIIALGGVCAAAPAAESALAMLQEAVGRRETIAGIVAVTVDHDGARLISYGSSGVANLAMDGNTVFEIGSITKVLTALMLADMAVRRDVAFDDPVAKYLPPSVNLHEHDRPIKLLDLATYTSGLPRMPDNMPPGWQKSDNPLADYTPNGLYEFLSGHTPAYEPGAHYEYANLGYGLLGLALARRAGKSYEELLVERICNPLGLNHTRITLSPDMRKHVAQGRDLDVRPTHLWDMPALQGAGAARSTANDLIVFLRACIGMNQTPLNGALARLLETRRPTPLAGTDAGLGWFISSDKHEQIVWKTGATGGCNTFIGFSTQRPRGAIVLANFLSRPSGGGPVDGTVLNIGMHMINSDFHLGDLSLLYR